MTPDPATQPASPVPRILVAGIGNIFLGDDAFGVEVAARLARRPLPEGVRVVDFGIRGLDLTYALLDGYDPVILVDATPRGGEPGTLYVLEPEPMEPDAPLDADASGNDVSWAEPAAMETHNLDPAKVLALVRAMGGRTGRLLVVGCEPAPLDPDAMQLGLSARVAAAIDEAVGLIEGLIESLIQDRPAPHWQTTKSEEGKPI